MWSNPQRHARSARRDIEGKVYWSDGDEFPEMIMEWYKSNDYQFIALSDHNILAEGEKWIELRDEAGDTEL